MQRSFGNIARLEEEQTQPKHRQENSNKNNTVARNNQLQVICVVFVPDATSFVRRFVKIRC